MSRLNPIRTSRGLVLVSVDNNERETNFIHSGQMPLSRGYTSESSSSEPFPEGISGGPLKNLSITQLIPWLSISYHQLIATVSSSDCRTWCHQPGGRYKVCPGVRVILIGWARSSKAPGAPGSWMEDHRTAGTDREEVKTNS